MTQHASVLFFFFQQEIDDCLVQAKDRSYDALVHFGKRGLNVAATAAVMAASKVLCWALTTMVGQVSLLGWGAGRLKGSPSLQSALLVPLQNRLKTCSMAKFLVSV